ncbi:MAG TPA: type IV secretion system protein [Vicinamibacterales bacterium]|jgi:type IV secretory pathway VirB6-like protein|nr:type IV secretion system protein [Vicinamibacterales bacterium]
MEPQPRLAIVGSIQQAITALLTTYEPEFLRFGYSLFVSFATILIVWQGIKMMLQHDSLGDNVFDFAKLLLFISFGYALIAFYESPIPGIGVSFSNLITDQAHVFANILDARSLELVFDHLDQLWGHFVQPDAWSILANLLYWLLLIVVTLAKVISLAIVAFGLIASAVCALLGPIFVPFFIVPKLDWLFWSWFKAFIQYSFMPVVAFAFLMIFERFIFQYLTTLPQGITEDYYLVYGLQALVIIGVFAAGILLVPTLTTSIFSGRGGGSVLPERLSYRL